MCTRTFVALLIAAVSTLSGCRDASVAPPDQIQGTWGAQHYELVADRDGARIEYDCAHGSIDEPLLLDSDGRFDLVGTHTREGGPVYSDSPPDVHPARFEGRWRDGLLELTVTLTDTGDVIGPFTLSEGKRGELYKCL